MKKLSLFITLFLFMVGSVMAQRTVSGVLSDANGDRLIGANVQVKDAAVGTVTDIDGKYSLEVPSGYDVLVISYTGYETQNVTLGASNIVNVVLREGVTLSTAVVTALGISREKKSLGYATQEVSGEDISTVKSGNFVNSLSGRAAGVQVKRNTNMGGSTNIIIRGNASIEGSNQALFVVDGVPISNKLTNTTAQGQARGGEYDYGNPASDINPDDIESINVLKGAAATALYGSRAANGVIMITTKKGTKGKSGLGVTINSGVTFGTVDKSTFAKYQEDYGAGYGPYYDGPGGHWFNTEIGGNSEDLLALVSEDASYGAAFDEKLLVYQWDALDPQSPNHLKKTPWVNAANGAITFFETPVAYTNSISIDKGLENGSFRVGYTNFDQKGLMPNSSIKRNNFSLATSYDLSKKLSFSASGNFINTKALGRNSTGYGDNIIGMFRQWWQTNVDVQDQKDVFELTDRNVTWNYADDSGTDPIFWDNPYWTRHKNFQNDERNRILGNVSLTYKLTDWLNIMGRVATDTYDDLQEERRAVGSIASNFGIGRNSVGSGYARRNIQFKENNYDAMLNFNKELSDKLSLSGVLGVNIRRQSFNSIYSSTNGGLSVPGIYSLQNSKAALPLPEETSERIGVNGFYGSASFSYDRLIFVELSARQDYSSTLPKGNNAYFYPAVSTSFVFSNLIDADWLSFGKVRLGYAQVSNDAPFDYISDSYGVNSPIGAPSTFVGITKANPDLRPEVTSSIEGGIEMFFLNKRAGIDLTLYKNNTEDQIIRLRTSEATGYARKIINAGEIENKGIELTLFGTPYKTSNFKWDVSLNWAKNTNTVVSLVDGLESFQLGSFQGGVTINARVGEPYGTIQGTDFTYLNGEKVIDEANGQYIKTSTSDQVIGNINADWNAGLNNRFSYKNISFSFLIDMQQGGSIFSLDQYYGLATGLYEETSFTNDLGNPVRNTLDEGGGFINPGVNENGNVNTTRIRADRFGAWGYRRGLPNSAFVYDASYVKLREMALAYTLPASMFANSFVNGATVSLVGSNLWIISKDLPHADPEALLSAGNLTGYSTGPLPSTRDFSNNLKIQF